MRVAFAFGLAFGFSIAAKTCDFCWFLFVKDMEIDAPLATASEILLALESRIWHTKAWHHQLST